MQSSLTDWFQSSQSSREELEEKKLSYTKTAPKGELAMGKLRDLGYNLSGLSTSICSQS